MTMKTVKVERDIQADRKQRADELRQMLTARGTFVVNLVSSPGAGKTSLLQAMARHWGGNRKMAVLVGDLATDRDAERLRPFVPVQQLTTGGACHLELSLVERGLQLLPQDDYEFLFIENIGNLVCPASHDLAEHLRAVVLSTTEGDDKPAKYPKMFRTSHVMVISKCDLLPYVPFSAEAATDDAHQIQPGMPVFSTCALTSQGISAWCDYLDHCRQCMLADHAQAKTTSVERNASC